jgi:hypothetical protein
VHLFLLFQYMYCILLPIAKPRTIFGVLLSKNLLLHPIHRLICPYIHEQNNIVERRHRYIVKTSLTLLKRCKALLWFWNYVFESSMHFFNRMHTLVLKNKSLFECLFHRTPTYDFLYLFECFLFSYLLPYYAYKLDFYSPSYVFLGYSSSHLVYRFLDLIS